MTKVLFFDADAQTQTYITNTIAVLKAKIEPIFIDAPISLENIDEKAEVISVFYTSKVTKEIIEAMPNLKLIACRSTGFDHVDLAAAKSHNVTVTNVPTYGEHTVAEFTFGLILSLLRKLPWAIGVTMQGNGDCSSITGHDLFGKTLGVVGAGKIGRNVAKIGQSFGMEVLVYDPIAVPEDLEGVELNELLAKSDVVTLHAPYTGANFHMISDVELTKMKQTAFLINTARGELVDTTALIKALQLQKISGAALDVIENEHLLLSENEQTLLANPHADKKELSASLQLSVLKNMPNVLLTQHNAFNTVEAIQRINETVIINITQFKKRQSQNVVEPKEVKQAHPGKLIISRHAESEWNALGKWTGITDVHLTPKGFHEAALLGEAVKENNLHIDFAYCSQQIRTLETLEGILDGSGQITVPYRRNGAINERDYGDLTGKNKWEVKEEIGEEAFNGIRRGWDYPVPNGETLKMVSERVLPFYEKEVLPRLQQGQNVLLVAHGNSIRALIKYLEHISDEDVANVEMIFGQILVYDVSTDGFMQDKNVLTIDTTPPKA